MDWVWDILQIGATADQREIKRAYARRSKEIHPEEMPEEFQKLYRAYQCALKYASVRGQDIGEKPAEPKEKQEEEKEAVSQTHKDGEGVDVDSGEMREELDRLAQIRFFQDYWNRQIYKYKREQGKEFLDREWKDYLQSDNFQKIMWSPIVLDIIAAGLKKYFQWKKEVVLFFWELYGLEGLEEDDLEGEGARLLCKILKPTATRNAQQQRIQSTARFMRRWKDQMAIWLSEEPYLSDDWIIYSRSEEFLGIMRSPIILRTIAESMIKYCQRKEEILLFFWELYGFEEREEKKYVGEELRLYMALHPAYTNFIKRQQFAANESENEKRELRHVICLSAGFICSMIITMYTYNFGTDKWWFPIGAAISLIPLCTGLYYFIRWFFCM